VDESCDISRLWLTAVLLAAVLPPCIVWAIRKRWRWQLSLRQFLLAIVVVAAALSLSHKDLALVLEPQDPYTRRIFVVSWRVGESSPWETMALVVVISLIFTFAFRSRADAAGDLTEQPGIANTGQQQSAVAEAPASPRDA
jgi:hypothetical protein